MKITIAICDDNREDGKMIQREVERIYRPLFDRNQSDYEIVMYETGNDLMKNLDAVLDNHILFLDIDMPGINGLEIAEAIEKKTHKVNLIFVTNRNDLVFEAIHFRPFRFLRKECLHEEIEEALLAVIAKMKEETVLCEFESGSEVVKIAVNEIVYLESSGHYVRVHTQDGNVCVVRNKISELERQLKLMGFVRIHIGYLVNIRNIYSISSKGVVLDNRLELPVSRKNVEHVKRIHAVYIRRYVRGLY